jgi:tetratricopeptide (TPR) repeat protein
LAIEAYREAIQLVREIGDKRREIGFRADVGALYLQIKKYDQAEKMLGEVVKVSRESNDQLSEGLAIGNIAEIYLARNEYQLAKTLFIQAIKICEPLNPDRLIQFNCRLSYILGKEGDLVGAVQYLIKAEEILADSKEEQYQVDYLYHKGVLALWSDRNQEAALLLKKLIQFREKSQKPQLALDDKITDLQSKYKAMMKNNDKQ